jgi:serine/threonine protein kinase
LHCGAVPPVVHRDIKSDNIMITVEDKPKVLFKQANTKPTQNNGLFFVWNDLQKKSCTTRRLVFNYGLV